MTSSSKLGKPVGIHPRSVTVVLAGKEFDGIATDDTTILQPSNYGVRKTAVQQSGASQGRFRDTEGRVKAASRKLHGSPRP